MNGVVAYLVGVTFAFGLGLGGMTQPAKVLAFLDVAGSWDPSLMLVMVGAIAVYALAYRVALRQRRPVFAAAFQIPTRREVDAPLLAGSVLFGIGWGLAGLVPRAGDCRPRERPAGSARIRRNHARGDDRGTRCAGARRYTRRHGRMSHRRPELHEHFEHGRCIAQAGISATLTDYKPGKQKVKARISAALLDEIETASSRCRDHRMA